MTRNQASGGLSVSVARSQARRHSGGGEPGRTRGGWVRSGSPGGSRGHPVIWVQAVTHCWNGTQSFLPLPHWASGVFQNLIVLK